MNKLKARHKIPGEASSESLSSLFVNFTVPQKTLWDNFLEPYQKGCLKLYSCYANVYEDILTIIKAPLTTLIQRAHSSSVNCVLRQMRST